jgi:putative ABC transport system substrate-binding protein
LVAVARKLLNSLVRPDGNTTGVSILAFEFDGKRQDILIEAVPDVAAHRYSKKPNVIVTTI